MPAAFEDAAQDGVARGRCTTEMALPSSFTSRIVSAFWRIEADLRSFPDSASTSRSGRRSILVRPITVWAVPFASVTSTWPPMARSDRYAVFPSGRRM
jgi:hypothetical protein